MEREKKAGGGAEFLYCNCLTLSPVFFSSYKASANALNALPAYTILSVYISQPPTWLSHKVAYFPTICKLLFFKLKDNFIRVLERVEGKRSRRGNKSGKL